jgi:hypothetical protein
MAHREIKQGNAHIWKSEPHIGPVMVKGLIKSNMVELFDMLKEEVFSVSRDEYDSCRNRTVLDEMLRVTDPEQWREQSAMWCKAWSVCTPTDG